MDWRWLAPGMGLKRWLSLASLGVVLINAGAIALTYCFFLEQRHGSTTWWHWGSGIGLMMLGTYVGAFGARRIIRAVVRAIDPTPPRLLDALSRRARRGPRVVAIGGGTGLATLLRGLKQYSDNLTAIVAMADNGGSSGRLRQELGALPPGDVRNCLTALAGEEQLLAELFSYRFRQGSSLDGHSFGNLFLTAMAEITGDFEKAVRASSKVLAVRGQVLPATLEPIELVATLQDGSTVQGESQISESLAPIASIAVEPSAPRALPEALKAIREADAIIIGPGSLFTSLAPNLLIPEIREAIRASKAPLLYVCNVMTQPGETDGYTVADHARRIREILGEAPLDVLVNRELPERLLTRYEAQRQYPVSFDRPACDALGVSVLEADLLDDGDLVRHAPDALASAVMKWLLARRREVGTKVLHFPEWAAKPKDGSK